MGNTLKKHVRNNSEQNQEHDHESFTCEICIEPMLLPDKKFKNLNRCIHPFCTDCMVKYIVVKLEDKVGDIPCPSLNCGKFLDPISCRNLLVPELFVKWCDVLCESAVLRLAQCYCPNQNCSALILDECGGNAKRSQCPNCKSSFCFKCKVPWHTGFRCRDRNDTAIVVLARRSQWKRCPKCRRFIERTSGCNHVKCRCGAEFCYNCGKARCNCARYRPDRTARWLCFCM